jgi:hypothetical protein
LINFERPGLQHIELKSGGKALVPTILFDLSGRVAVVNGGIGRSIAIGLAQAGAAGAVLVRNEERTNASWTSE